MVVAMPPSRVANPMGSRIPEADCFARSDAPIKIGSNMTTMGVLLRNARLTAPTTSMARRE